jgi:hypothetical protein
LDVLGRASEAARPGSGSAQRSVARASYRRKTRRIVHSPLSSRKRGDGVLGSSERRCSRCKGGAYPRASDRRVRSSIVRELPRPIPEVRSVRSGGSGRRRRETSCPSIHRAPGLIPRGREVGREPRARVQVDRLVGWQKSVGHIAICIGRSQPGASLEDADACSRWRQGEPVCHACHGTLQIREKQTTWARSRVHVSEHDRRRLGSRQCVPFTGPMRRGLGPAGSSKLRDGWGRSCGACRTTSRRQRWDRSR